MEILRTVNGYELNVGNGMAKGLFNISHSEKKLISLWFDAETKNQLLMMSDSDFNEYAIKNTD